MAGASAGQDLPAADDRVDRAGVEFQPKAAPTSALGGDQARAAAEKGIEHNVAVGRAVEDRVGDHRHRLHARVQRRQIAVLVATGEGTGPRVVPNIAAVAAAADSVAVPVAAVLENEDQLVLAAVKRARASDVLDPNAEVLGLAIGAMAGG